MFLLFGYQQDVSTGAWQEAQDLHRAAQIPTAALKTACRHHHVPWPRPADPRYSASVLPACPAACARRYGSASEAPTQLRYVRLPLRS